eukprot:CFRG6101T1
MVAVVTDKTDVIEIVNMKNTNATKQSAKDTKVDKPYVLAKRMVPIFEKEFCGGVKLREYSAASATNNCVMVTGFAHGSSLTPFIAANFLVESLKLPLVATLSAPELPARAIVEMGQPAPGIRIHGNAMGVCVALCEFKLPSNPIINGVIAAVVDFSARHNIKFILSAEGVPRSPTATASELDNKDKDETNDAEVTSEAEKILFLTTCEKVSQALLLSNDEPPEAIVPKATVKDEVDGEQAHLLKEEGSVEVTEKPIYKPLDDAVINGVTGGLIAEASLTGMDVCCILVPASAVMPLDVSAAYVVVDTVRILVKGLDLDLSPLQDKAKQLKITEKDIENMRDEENTHSAGYGNMYM